MLLRFLVEGLAIYDRKQKKNKEVEMAVEKERASHIWKRDEFDWYVEPEICSEALFIVEKFDGSIWDPACGMGRIVSSAISAGYEAVGTDLNPKANSIYGECYNFLTDYVPIEKHNIVSNPPFGIAEEFVIKAIEDVKVGGKVAMILPLVWMAGFSTKRSWLPVSPLMRVYPISPRPSMPPAAVIMSGEKPGNGTKDFAWFVWEKGYEGHAQIAFMNTRALTGK